MGRSTSSACAIRTALITRVTLIRMEQRSPTPAEFPKEPARTELAPAQATGNHGDRVWVRLLPPGRIPAHRGPETKIATETSSACARSAHRKTALIKPAPAAVPLNRARPAVGARARRSQPPK